MRRNVISPIRNAISPIHEPCGCSPRCEDGSWQCRMKTLPRDMAPNDKRIEWLQRHFDSLAPREPR